jgi:hypothetical protein
MKAYKLHLFFFIFFLVSDECKKYYKNWGVFVCNVSFAGWFRMLFYVSALVNFQPSITAHNTSQWIFHNRKLTTKDHWKALKVTLFNNHQQQRNHKISNSHNLQRHCWPCIQHYQQIYEISLIIFAVFFSLLNKKQHSHFNRAGSGWSSHSNFLSLFFFLIFKMKNPYLPNAQWYSYYILSALSYRSTSFNII